MDTYPFDTLRDAFLRFLAEGMNHEEALDQFDEAEFRKAAIAELDDKLIRIVTFEESIEQAGNWVTNDERKLPALFDLVMRAGMERKNGVHGADYQQALDLWQAGWTSEDHGPRSPVMSWYWRAPSKRPGKPGRKYLSTNQAHRAMKKLTEIQPPNPPQK